MSLMMSRAVFLIICIHFKTDVLVAIESEQSSCTQYLDGGNSGHISSPGYPDNYPNNVNFTMIITARSNKTRVNFDVLNLEAENDGNWSCFDYLKIERVDVSPCCNMLFNGCRNHTNSIMTEGKQFRVSFVSDAHTTRKGFMLFWKADGSIESERRYYTENLNSTSGQITSPGYPCNYPNNVNYTWVIQTAYNDVNFTIPDLEAEPRAHGEWYCVDYLKIERTDPCCITVTKGCRFQRFSILVKGGHFRVSFISDYSKTARGFRLYWQDAKSSKFKEDTGYVILSLFGLLIFILPTVIGVLLVVMMCIVCYYRKKIQRKCSQPMSGGSEVNENIAIYENIAGYQRSFDKGPKSNNSKKSTKLETYTELQF